MAELPLRNPNFKGVVRFDEADSIVGLPGGGGTPTAITVADEAADATCFPLFVTAATGDLGPKSNANFTFNALTGAGYIKSLGVGNPASGAEGEFIWGNVGGEGKLDIDPVFFCGRISAASSLVINTPYITIGTDQSHGFIGNAQTLLTALEPDLILANSAIDAYINIQTSEIVGNWTTKTGTFSFTGGLSFASATSITGTLPVANGGTGNTTGTATNITVGSEGSDTTCFVLFVKDATGDVPPKSNTSLTFNSATGELAATSFSGLLSVSNVTGLGSGVAAALGTALNNANGNITASNSTASGTVLMGGGSPGTAASWATTTGTGDPVRNGGPTFTGALTLTTGGMSTGGTGAHIGADASGRFCFSTSGSTDIGILVPGSTSTAVITLPSVSGTLATLSGTEVLAGKTLTAPVLGVATGTSLALGGATIGSNALAVTGTSNFSTNVTLAGGVLTLPNGLVGAPPINLGDATTGFYRRQANEITVALSGAANFAFNATSFYGLKDNSAIILGVATDVILIREAAATLQIGNDAAGPVSPQTFKAADRITSDGVGADLIIAGGRNRGDNAGGAVILQTSAPAAAAAAGVLANRQYIYGGEKALTSATATIVCNITLAAGTYIGGRMTATTHALEGTKIQAITEDFTFAAVNKAGTVTATIQATPSTSTLAESEAGSTLTTAWTIVVNGNSVDIKQNANSSLSETVLSVSWQLILNGNAAQVITP